MKIAVLSDIHGNSWALESVLEDIRQKGVTRIYDLGDSLYGPLDPQGTFELIIRNGIKSLSGNEDRLIVENLDAGVMNQTLNFILSELSINAIDWLKGLPQSRQTDNEIYLCHGAPGIDTEYLIEKLNTEFVGIKDLKKLDELLNGINERIVFCGHSHCQRFVETGRKIIINPGSVGCPAFDDDLPVPHKMENFSPMARYCIFETGKNIKIDQMAVSYDFEKAAKRAEENNRYDWAKWIRTGTSYHVRHNNCKI